MNLENVMRDAEPNSIESEADVVRYIYPEISSFLNSNLIILQGAIAEILRKSSKEKPIYIDSHINHAIKMINMIEGEIKEALEKVEYSKGILENIKLSEKLR